MRLIRGTRIQIVGSVQESVGTEPLAATHDLVRGFTRRILSEGGGLVVTLTGEPMNDQRSFSIIFDWTILETANDFRKENGLKWPSSQGAAIIAVGLPNCLDRIPENRQELWRELASSGIVQLVKVRTGLSIGGVLREQQAPFGDILVSLGGNGGVEHLAAIYTSNHKPVIPLNFSFGSLKTDSYASQRLAKMVLDDSRKFFEFADPSKANAAFSLLCFKSDNFDRVNYEKIFFDFLYQLARPKAFLIHLMDQGAEDFVEVEKFLRNVVDPILDELQLDRFDISMDKITEGFLNVEIFRRLHSCSLVIADLTGLRPNCFMELGFAFGREKKVIVTCKKGIILPFDSASIPCYFWHSDHSDEERRTELKEFMARNMSRGLLVSTQDM